MAVTLDTHSFIWFLDQELNKKLSAAALKAIKEAEQNDKIYLPIIAMVELLHLIERGKIKLSFLDILNKVMNSRNYQIIPLDVDLLKIAINLQGLEIHDRLILASAIKTDTSLISKDQELHLQPYKVIW